MLASAAAVADVGAAAAATADVTLPQQRDGHQPRQLPWLAEHTAPVVAGGGAVAAADAAVSTHAEATTADKQNH